MAVRSCKSRWMGWQPTVRGSGAGWAALSLIQTKSPPVGSASCACSTCCPCTVALSGWSPMLSVRRTPCRTACRHGNTPHMPALEPLLLLQLQLQLPGKQASWRASRRSSHSRRWSLPGGCVHPCPGPHPPRSPPPWRCAAPRPPGRDPPLWSAGGGAHPAAAACQRT
jgi:hypothetical protein